MYEYESAHKCSLRLRDTRPAFPPLSPSVDGVQRCLRSVRKLLILNERDTRCKHFLKTASALRNEKRRHAISKYWYIIHPFSKLSQYIEVIFLLSMIHRWIFVMNMFVKANWYLVTSYLRDFLHIIIMISFFITGYVKHSTKEIFIHPRETVKHYLYSYFFIDLFMLLEQNSVSIIIIKTVEAIYGPGDELTIEKVAAPFALVSLIIYMIRSRSILHVIGNTARNAGCGKTITFLLEQLSMLSFVLHFYTFLLFVIPYNIYVRDNQVPTDSWISIRNLTITDYTFNTYFEGLVIVLSYFFGSYHYDIIKRPIEQLLLFLFSFTGRFFVFVIIGRVLSNFGYANRADTDYENMLIQVNSYMRANQVPIEIQEEITERFKYNYQRKYFNVQQMMAILTDHLKTELFLFGAKSLISKNPFLKTLKTNEIALLFSYMKSTIFSRHEVILSGYQTYNNVYFILSGTVAGYTSGLEIFHAKDGDAFGLASLISSRELAIYWYVIAIETTEVYFISKRKMQSFIHDHPDMGKYFLAVFTDRRKKFEALIRQKYEGGEDIRDLLRRGLLLEKPKRRENVDMDYNPDAESTK